jgi:hypothetical protein
MHQEGSGSRGDHYTRTDGSRRLVCSCPRRQVQPGSDRLGLQEDGGGSWTDPGAPLRALPAGEADSEKNLLTTNGINRMLNLTIAGGGQALTNTATRLGTGNGVGTAAVGDTDLSAAAGSANRWFQVMDATFPSVATNVLTAKATWATGDGNYAWNEWGLDVGTPTVTSGNTVAALLFNHKTSAALGTKTTGTWVLTVTVTVT